MVILMLAAMLILSAVISAGAAQPVLGAFVLFAALYLVYLTACLLPGYARARDASAIVRTASRASRPARPAGLGSGVPASR